MVGSLCDTHWKGWAIAVLFMLAKIDPHTQVRCEVQSLLITFWHGDKIVYANSSFRFVDFINTVVVNSSLDIKGNVFIGIYVQFLFRESCDEGE